MMFLWFGTLIVATGIGAVLGYLWKALIYELNEEDEARRTGSRL